MTGWDEQKPHGVQWHLTKCSNTCSTAKCGLAAIRLANLEQQNQARQHHLVAFSNKCMFWIFETLQDPEDLLIRGGVDPNKQREDGFFEINGTKWAYNQSTPSSLAAMCFSFTKDRRLLEMAQCLAMAVTNKNKNIFDRGPLDHSTRYYCDSLAFYQLLAEGFADYHLYLSGGVSQESLQRTRDEAVREAWYLCNYLKDTGCKSSDNNDDGSSDGGNNDGNDGDESELYFRGFELFILDEKRLKL